MAAEKKLIYTAASSWYRAYTPLFKWCCEQSYPGVDVRVEIVSGIRAPFYCACSRLLMRPPGEYDRIYVTDVDLFHLPLHPDLFEYHEARMQATGLCYSNSPRGNREPRGDERLTGLHMATPEWYDKTRDARARAMELLNDGVLGGDRFDDEVTLKSICIDSGLEIPPRERLLSRHFGLHAGTLRCYRNHTRNTRDTELSRRITQDMATLWNEMIDTDGFREAACESAQMSDRVAWQLHALEMFTRKWSPVKNGNYFLAYV